MSFLKLTDVAKINMGQSPSSETYNSEKNGLPFYQGNVDFGEKYPTARIWCDKPTKIAEPGDILISVRAPIGALNYANEKCCIGRGLAAITPNPDMTSSEFIYWLLRAKYEYLNQMGTGSTFKAINRKTLESVELPKYSKDEQRHIAEILSKVDKVIGEKKAQINRLDELIRARFVEMFGDPINNSKGLPVKRISEFAKCIAGATPSTAVNEYWENGTIPWMSSGEVNLGRIYDTEKKISQKGYDNTSTKLIPAHTVVIAMAGQGKTRGTVGVAEIELCTNQSLCSVITDGTVMTDYLYSYLKLMYDELRNASNGDGGRGGLNLKIIGAFPVIVPSLKCQGEYTAIVSQVDRTKLILQKTIEKTQLLFDSLMQEYFG